MCVCVAEVVRLDRRLLLLHQLRQLQKLRGHETDDEQLHVSDLWPRATRDTLTSRGPGTSQRFPPGLGKSSRCVLNNSEPESLSAQYLGGKTLTGQKVEMRRRRRLAERNKCRRGNAAPAEPLAPWCDFVLIYFSNILLKVVFSTHLFIFSTRRMRIRRCVKCTFLFFAVWLLKINKWKASSPGMLSNVYFQAWKSQWKKWNPKCFGNLFSSHVHLHQVLND